MSSTRDLTTRVEETGTAEVDEVASALNAMLARLEGSVAARNHIGGTAPAQVKAAVQRAKEKLAAR